MSVSLFSDLICSECQTVYVASDVQNFCKNVDCSETLLARYNFQQVRISKDKLKNRPFTMWRYREFLPVIHPENIVSLGEGGTPLFKAERLGKLIGLPHLYWKDEASNPTGSFKARGMSAAISKAKELGIKKLAIPTAGNAGVALAAYGARAGMETHVYMPRETPDIHKKEVEYYGGNLIEIDGNIGDCGKLIAELAPKFGWFNVSTLKEPYRLEGKKRWVMNWPSSLIGNYPM